MSTADDETIRRLDADRATAFDSYNQKLLYRELAGVIDRVDRYVETTGGPPGAADLTDWRFAVLDDGVWCVSRRLNSWTEARRRALDYARAGFHSRVVCDGRYSPRVVPPLANIRRSR